MKDVVEKQCWNKTIGIPCNPYSEETGRSRHTAQNTGYCEDCSERLGLQDPPGRVPVAHSGDEEQMRNAGHGGQGGYGQRGSYGADWGYNTTGGPSGTGGHSGTAGSTETGMYGEYRGSTGGYGGTGVQSAVGGQSRTLGPDPGSAEVPIPLDPDRKGGGLSGAAVWKRKGHKVVPGTKRNRDKEEKREYDKIRREHLKRQREDEERRREDEKRRRGDKKRR